MKTRQKIYSYLYKLISLKDYSEKELREKVKNKFRSEREILDEVIEEFKQKGFIDDLRLARNIISYKTDMLYGPAKISEILYIKGLNDFKEMVYEYFDNHIEQIEESLKEKISKRYYVLSGKKDLKVYEKLLRYLIARGYDYGFSKKIVSEVMRNESDFS